MCILSINGQKHKFWFNETLIAKGLLLKLRNQTRAMLNVANEREKFQTVCLWKLICLFMKTKQAGKNDFLFCFDSHGSFFHRKESADDEFFV